MVGLQRERRPPRARASTRRALSVELVEVIGPSSHTPDDIARVHGVDVELLGRCCPAGGEVDDAFPHLLDLGDTFPEPAWVPRPRQAPGDGLPPLIGKQRELLNEWCRHLAEPKQLLDPGAALYMERPPDWFQLKDVASSSESLERQHWNAVVHALAHRDVWLHLSLGEPPRLEHIAIPGVCSAVARCYIKVGTAVGGEPKAQSVTRLYRALAVCSAFLWSRAATYVKSRGARGLPVTHNLAGLPARLLALWRENRDFFDSSLKMFKRSQARGVNAGQVANLVGAAVPLRGMSQRRLLDKERRKKVNTGACVR